MNTTEAVTQETINDYVGSAHGNLARVKELLEAHPELLNSDATWHETAIEAAAQMGRRDIIEYLLEKGAPLSITTAAVMGMRDKVTEILREDPTQKDATGAHGLPAMWFPAVAGDVEVAEILYNAGASIEGMPGFNTPLHAAAGFGKPAMVEWLLARGADPSAKDYDGKIPLEVAEANGQEETARLLRAGA